MTAYEKLGREIAGAREREEVYVCQSCQDVGYVVQTVEGVQRASVCGCSERKVQANRMRRAGLPARYQGASFANFALRGADPTVAHAAMVCGRMVDEMMHSGGQGLLMTGSCGVGKTHLAAAALRAAIERYGVTGRFWDMADLLTQIKRAFGREGGGGGEGGSESALVKEFAEVAVLVVDELGGERLTEWSYGEVGLLLNARYNAIGARANLTIFTTNFSNLGAGAGVGGAETLGDRIGSRMFSRLQEMCRVEKMMGRDFRATEFRRLG